MLVADAPPRVTHRYNFHGLGLTLSGESDLLSALDSRLALLHPSPSQADDIRFEFDTGPRPSFNRPSGSLRRVYEPESGEVVYQPQSDRLYLAFGKRIRALCDPTAGVTRVWIDRPTRTDHWLLSHPIFTLPWLETLKRRGLYSVHAAGLGRGGRGLILVGASGSGKTTLSLALARAGFDFLGDDMLFLSTHDQQVTVHAFPDEVDVTESTIRFFPELAPLLEHERPAGWPKWSFRVEALYGARAAWTTQPGAIVFPHIDGSANSRLEPLSGEEALLEMLPNVLLTEPLACQAHLAALARLSALAPCYRLWTGRDFDRLPGMLGSLLG